MAEDLSGLNARFQADGFLSLPEFTDAATVQELRSVYDALLSGEIDCSPTDRKLGSVTRQIMQLWKYHPVFRTNAAFLRGREMAKVLLGVDEPQPVFDMLIFKEPRQLATTPWHQDFAYSGSPFAAAGSPIPGDIVQFWVALDDVDVSNGCMQFVPGEHRRGLLPHYVAGGAPTDEGRLLAIEDPETLLDLGRAVACPLKAGGATVHAYGTPHFTSGNETFDRPRRAYIFNFARPDRPVRR